MLHSIREAIESASSTGAVLDLYAVVTGLYAAHEDENMALEDIAKLVIRDAALASLPVVFHKSWNAPPETAGPRPLAAAES
jgi:hypothetical protein